MPEVSETPNKIVDWRKDPSAAQRFAVTRVAVSIRVYCHAGQKTPIYDAGKTIAVGGGGGVILVAAPVVVDELVLLIHPKSGREMVCRVHGVEPSGSGLYQVVLEFSEEAPDFWGVELSPTPEPEPVPVAVSSPKPEKPAKTEKPAALGVPVPDFPVAMPSPAAARIAAPPAPIARPVLGKPLSSAPVAQAAASRKTAVIEAPEVAAENPAEDASSDASTPEYNGRWRTPRLHLETRVLVTFPGEAKPRECTTINIGASSALLQLPEKVNMGQSLVLTNPNSRGQISCQVRYIKERSPQVVHVGVEFVKEARRFWGISFPPENWDPSERKRPTQRG